MKTMNEEQESDDCTVVIEEQESQGVEEYLETLLIAEQVCTTKSVNIVSNHRHAIAELDARVSGMMKSTHPAQGNWQGPAPTANANWWTTKVSFMKMTTNVTANEHGSKEVELSMAWPQRTVEQETIDASTGLPTTVKVKEPVYNGKPHTYTSVLDKLVDDLSVDWLEYGVKEAIESVGAPRYFPEHSHPAHLFTKTEMTIAESIAAGDSGLEKLVRNMVPNTEYYEIADYNWVADYANKSAQIRLDNEIRQELAENPELYMRNVLVEVEMLVRIDHTIRPDFKKVMKNKDELNERFDDVTVEFKHVFSFDLMVPFNNGKTLKLPEERFTSRLPEINNHKERRGRSGGSFAREIDRSLNVLDNVSADMIVEINHTLARQLIVGITNGERKQDELRRIIRPFTVKGGSVPGDEFKVAIAQLRSFCKENDCMEYYLGFNQLAVKKITQKTQHNTTKGTEYSPMYAAFKNMVGQNLYDREWNLFLQDTKDLTDALKDAGNVVWQFDKDQLLERITHLQTFELDMEETSPYFTTVLLVAQDRILRSLFMLAREELRVIAKEIKEAKAAKKRPARSDEDRANMRTTVFKNSVVPMMNRLDPTVTVTRSVGDFGRKMSMVEAADRLLTQANVQIRRIAPDKAPIQHLTIRRRLVTANRDGTIRSLCMPAHRVLRRKQVRIINPDGAEDLPTVDVSWVPAVTYRVESTPTEDKQKVYADSKKKAGGRKFTWGKMSYEGERQQVCVNEFKLEIKPNYTGSSKDRSLRKDWIFFGWNDQSRHHKDLVRAFSSVATIGIENDSVLVQDTDPGFSGIFDEIQIDSGSINDAVKGLTKHLGKAANWNSAAFHVVVDFEDIVDVRDYNRFQNIHSDRQPKDFPRYLESQPNGYDTLPAGDVRNGSAQQLDGFAFQPMRGEIRD